MSYTKRTDIDVLPGELAVQLDAGHLIAVRCDRKPVDAGVCYHAQARAIDAAGITQASAAGRPLVTEHKHVVPVAVMEALGDAAIARECLLLVLGEPLTLVDGHPLIRWADTTITGVSIRNRIAQADVDGAADAGAVL